MSIVVIEGCDAAGKATQLKKLTKTLHEAVTYDFPHYQTPTGALIKKVLSNKGNDTFSPGEWALLLQSLMTTNRQEANGMLESYSGPMAGRKICLLDRYYASGLVYGEADGLDRDYLINIHRGLVPADVWILIDISVEESFRRRPVRRDHYESRVDLLNKVRTGYLKLFNENPNPFPGTWKIVDGHQSDEAVHSDIMKELRYLGIC